MTIMQRMVGLIYPNQCAYCSALVDEEGGLCAACWRDTKFISGNACELCAVPLMGESDGQTDLCDECMTTTRPWDHGRAALQYDGIGRRLALALKYGDRTDLAGPAAHWMARAAGDLLCADTLVIPVPSHWRRLLARRYNPAAELARAIATRTSATFLPDALVRHRATPTQEGLGRDARFANLENAISLHSSRSSIISGKSVCVVDDTMASGATLTAAVNAVLTGKPHAVSVLVLARAVKTP